MTRDELLAYCLAKPGAWRDEPWDGDVVAKVGPKIFAFLGSDEAAPSVGLKCAATREAADEWLARYPGDASVMRYIGRSGWNTLLVGRAIRRGTEDVVICRLRFRLADLAAVPGRGRGRGPGAPPDGPAPGGAADDPR